MPVVDTSFLIDAENGLPSAVACLRALSDTAQDVLLPAQTAIELLAGEERMPNRLRELDESFRFVGVDRLLVLEAARLAAEAHRHGVFPGWADVQIAALASLEGTYVITADVETFRSLGCAVWDYRRKAAPPADVAGR